MAAGQFTIDRLYTKDLWVNGAQINHPSLAALLTDHPSNNVGIGTNDPKVKLDINGTNALRLPAGNKISVASGGDRPADGDADYCIRYNTDDNIFEGYSNGVWGSLGGVTSINQKVTITADNTDGLKFLTGPDGGTSTERMRILNDGQVNIGSINDVVSVIDSKAATTYVDSQINYLIGSAPGALDTLNELAAALGDDANFSTTVTNSIALKAPVASPNFTGGIDVTGTVTADTAGIGLARTDGTLHVHTASAGTVTASTQADDLVIENSAEGGITLITPDNQSARIRFTSPATNGTDTGGGELFYRQNIAKVRLASTQANGVLSLSTGTGGVDRLLIDSAGRVTMPSQPAWHIGGSASSSGSSVTVLFQNEFTDIGNCYNASTGRMTAPVAGMYHFEATVLMSGVSNSDDSLHINARVNGNNKFNGNIRNVGESANGNYFAYGGFLPSVISGTIYLGVGDYLTINISTSGNITAYNGTDWATFSGFLVG